MMKNFFFLVSLFSFYFFSLDAALPPLYQGTKEIISVLEDPNIGKFIDSSESILEIKKVENGYKIRTSKQEILAKIVLQKATKPGPIPFEIQFQKMK